MRKSLYTIILFISLTFISCSSGYDRQKAEAILEKSELTESDYSELLRLYEIGMDDALQFAQKERNDLTEDDREEILSMFEIGKRLMIDEDKLSPEQVKEFERITQKGTQGLDR